jgi:hypothetical protein
MNGPANPPLFVQHVLLIAAIGLIFLVAFAHGQWQGRRRRIKREAFRSRVAERERQRR